MELDKTLHRALDDGAQATSGGFGCLGEDVAIVVGDGADEVHIKRFEVFVLAYVAHEERFERIKHKSVYGGILDVLDKEGSNGSEETVGLRLLVDTADDGETVEFVLFEKFLAQFGGELIFEDIAHKNFTEDSARTFIAEDITQGRYIVADFFTVVET